MENSDISSISDVLSRNPTALRNWRRIYDYLELEPAEGDELSRGKINLQITEYELLSKILRSWKSKNAEEATEENLVELLRTLDLMDVAEQILTRADNKTLSFRPLKFPIRHNYEGVVSKYVSRSSLETEIINGLRDNSNAGFHIDFPVVVLQGIGGVGKTTLARNIFRLEKNTFGDNSIWINAEKEEFIINDFAKLFGVTDNDKDKIKATLAKCYSSQLKNKRCLLVFDNAENYKMILEYLPLNLETKISVLITSNVIWNPRELGEIRNIPIPKFSEIEFSSYVTSIVKNASENEVKPLDEYAGRIPYLACVVCFGYAEQRNHRQDIDLEEYLQIDENKREALDYIIYKKTAKDIVSRQMMLIQKYHVKSGEIVNKLLYLMAYCESRLSKHNLLDLSAKFEAFNSSSVSVEGLIEILFQQGFLEEDKDNLIIHRSYQDAIQSILRDQKREQQQIEQILAIDADEVPDQCLSFSILWELGKEYGDGMFEKMAYSKYFLPALIKHEIDDGVKLLAAYLKRSKTEKEYAVWILFGVSRLGSRSIIYKIGNYVVVFVDNLVDLRCTVSILWETRYSQMFRDLIRYMLSNKNKLITPWLDNLKNGNLIQPTALHNAALFGELSALEYFIKQGVDINGKDKDGHTALRWAVGWDRMECVKYLLKAGADPNIQNNFGWTPLHSAADRNEIETTELLLSYNADIQIKTNSGETALILAKDNGHIEIIKLLKDHKTNNLNNVL